jgi:cellulose synthase/poly-beta-1,6-N-acetylglucosamine synthase-like glycosyltransferase
MVIDKQSKVILMDTQPELSIVIPAYNEEENLRIILPDLLAFAEERNWQVVITNDGSRDQTKEVLQGFASSSRLKVVHHKLNKGYGAATPNTLSPSTPTGSTAWKMWRSFTGWSVPRMPT